MRKFLLSITVLLTLFTYSESHAQLTVNQSLTGAQLVSILTGGNMGSVSNISYTGSANACGSFTTGGTPTNLGLTNGLILASGNASNAIGPNASYSAGTSLGNAGYTLLNTLAGATTYDAAVLQFDFIPTNNTISFRYVFGSEEYDEFVNGGYNDAFAFFISGPNPLGGNYNNVNIALVPSTTQPVSIDNVNKGYAATGVTPTGCTNCAYYVSNIGGSSIQYDGFTTPLTATVNVVPCNTYTLKLCIADAGDYIYDSGVFIEQGSFTGINDPGTLTHSTPVCGGSPVTLTYNGTGIPTTWTFPSGSPSTGSGAGPYNVTWSANGSYTASLVVNAGCLTTITDVVTVNNPAPTASSNSPICAGQTLNLSSAAGASSYSWSGPNGFTSSVQNPSISSATTAASGTYTVTVTNANGCTGTASTTVTVNIGVTPTISNNGPICAGATLNLSASGGASYSWSGPNSYTSSAQNPSISSTTTAAAGIYTVTITSSAGCTITTTTNAVVNALPTVSATNTSPYCAGSTVSLFESGGSGNSWSWSGPNGFSSTQQNPQITNATTSASGTYNVTVTNSNTCTNTSSTIVTVNSNPTISFSVTNVNCYSGTDGVINSTISNGATPYTYNWSNGAISQNLNGISAGSYSVTVTDANSCTGTNNTSVSQPAAALGANNTFNNVNCYGGSDGSISINVNGGTTPYTYHWSSGQATEDLTNISAGNYDLTITDAHNCTTTQSVVISQPLAPLTATTSQTDVLCYGNYTGAIDLSPTGGTSPYTYNWSNSAVSQDLNNIASGSYLYTVTDAHSCTTTGSVNVIQPSAALTATNTYINVDCNGNTTGSINLTPAGGTTPYTYNWSNGNNTEDISSLAAATYNVTVTDAHNCTTNSTATITQPNTLVATISSTTNVNCFGESNGAIDLSVQGGTTPYSYHWNGGQATEDLTSIPAGIYSATVTDAHNCTATTATTITEPTELTAPFVKTDVKCYGDHTGMIDVTPNGGTLPWTYNWSTGEVSQDLNNIQSGTYQYTVTDGHSCTATGNVTITQPIQPLTLSNTVINVDCYGNATGSVNLSAYGGTIPYNFSWSNGNVSEDISSLTAGNYSVTVTDANSCSSSSYATITEPNELTSDFTSLDVSCFGGNNGSINLSVYEGTIPYTYSWSNGPITEDLSNLQAGTYSVTVSDSHNCKTYQTITISQPSAPLTATQTQTNVLCYGNSTGAINITTNGGTSPYTYSWSTGQSSQNLNNIIAGTYSLTVTDANICTTIVNVTITQPLNPLTTTISQNDTICQGESSNLFEIVYGGTTPYTYSWKDPSGNVVGTSSSYQATPAATTVYSVTVTDNNGCTTPPDYVTVAVSPQMNLSFTVENNSCFHASDGVVKVTVSGGVQPFTYSWNSATNIDSNVWAGNYTLTVTDKWLCDAVGSYTVTEPPLVTYTTEMIPASCKDRYDGQAIIHVNGGTPPFSYSWSNGGSYIDTLISNAGQYTITATDVNYCSIISSITITEPTAVLLITPENQSICNGQSTTLSVSAMGGTPPYTFDWNWPTNQTFSGNPLSVSPINPTVYTVIAKDKNLCYSISKNIFVNVSPLITVDIVEDKFSICPGETITVNTDISGGTGGPYYCTLQDGSIVTPPFELQPEGENTSLMYYLSVTDFCTTTIGLDSTKVTILPLPPVDFTADTTAGCQPLTINFNESNPNLGQTYLWDFGDNNNISTKKNPQYTFDEAGVYDISLTVTSSDGCENTQIYPEMITVYPKPDAKFFAEPATASIIDATIYFENYSSGHIFSFWDFGDNTNSNDENPYHKYKSVGEFYVTLYVESQHFCKDTAETKVIIRDENTFYAPTAFSPGTDGINDLFFISGNSIDPEYFMLIIYDRWGEVVFQSDYFDAATHVSDKWDGRVKNHSIAEIGTYTWYCTYKSIEGQEYQKSGPVTIVR